MVSEDAYRQVKARLDLAVTDLGTGNSRTSPTRCAFYAISVPKPAQAKPVEPARSCETEEALDACANGRWWRSVDRHCCRGGFRRSRRMRQSAQYIIKNVPNLD
jgi:hypothetical protein